MRRIGLVAPVAVVLLLAPAFLAGAAPSTPPPDQRDLYFTFVSPNLPLQALVSDFSVNFNPKDLSVNKSVGWGSHGTHGDDVPTLEFTSAKPYTLSFELMFDGYETETDVSRLVAALEKYVALPDEKRPPMVKVTWGKVQTFDGVLESISVKYTIFMEDGTPVRAVVDTTWREFTPAKNETSTTPRH